MTRRWVGIVVLLVATNLLPWASRAEAEGVLQGRMLNETVGGASVEGIEVALRTFQGQTESAPRSATVDTQGRFTFEGLDTGEDWRYFPSVRYDGVVYSRGMIAFRPNETVLDVELPVYETTTDEKGISAERVHLFITATGSTLSVSELYVLLNPADRTYVGTSEAEGRRWTSRFYLPQGSRDVVFDDGQLGGRFLPLEGGFADAEPLWPGRTNVMFSYQLDCPGGTCDLSRAVTHPIANVNVLIPDVGARLDSDRVTFERKLQTQQGDQLNYVGRGIGRGEVLGLRVRLPGGTGPATAASQRASRLPWFVLGGVLVALVLAYPFWLERVRAAAVQQGARPRGNRGNKPARRPS